MDNDIVKTSTKLYKTTLPYNMIFTKDYAYASDDQVATPNITQSYTIGVLKKPVASIPYLSFQIMPDLYPSVHRSFIQTDDQFSWVVPIKPQIL